MKEAQNRLLELGYRSRRSDDTTTQPQRGANAEATVFSNPHELLDLVDEPVPVRSAAVQRFTNIVDVAFH
jgi:hypothetical protein